MAEDNVLVLDIMNEHEGYSAPEDLIAKVLSGVWEERGKGKATLNLLLVDDGYMSELNHRHKGQESTTDVLAFEGGEEDPATGILHLGDIAVSVDVGIREAEARGVPADNEVVLYSLHGMLHLLGMRDHTGEARAQMIEVQAEIMARNGLEYIVE